MVETHGARPGRPARPAPNAAIAAKLREAADLLAAQAADPFRATALATAPCRTLR